jgi:hypothetical protein
MASQLDTAFFRRAKRANRAVEILDHEAVIPAVDKKPEIRVKLPIRRLKTLEEREAAIQENRDKIEILDAEIEVERKNLLDLVQAYRTTGSGVSEVVATNLKVKGLMERRSALQSPGKWIEELGGLTLKDVFASKRDERKLGSNFYQIKRRVEPIESLFVNIAVPGSESEVKTKVSGTSKLGKPVGTVAVAPAANAEEPKIAAEAAQGVIIGQKRVLKTKKAASALPALPSLF